MSEEVPFKSKKQSEAVIREKKEERPFNPNGISPWEAHGALFNTPVEPQEKIKTFDEISREIKAENRKNKIKSVLHRVNPFK